MHSDERDDLPPAPPIAPEPGACCGTGCVPCVFDVYEEALERYRMRLKAWNERTNPSSATPDRSSRET